MHTGQSLKIGDLLHFVEYTCGGRAALLHLSCYDVLRDIILPLTSQTNQSLETWIENNHPRRSIFPSDIALLVAHSMEDPFLGLVDALCHYLSKSNTMKVDPDLWIDMFCINYHRIPTFPSVNSQWISQVHVACRKMEQTVLILSPWDSCNGFRDPLCLYQLFLSGLKDTQFDIAMSSAETERFLKVAKVSKKTVEHMFTSNICLQEVKSSFGGYAPQNGENTLFHEFISTQSLEHQFCAVIYKKIREWLDSFFVDNFSNAHLKCTDIYAFKISEWMNKTLVFFEETLPFPQQNDVHDSVDVSEKIAFCRQFLESQEAQELGIGHHKVVAMFETLIDVYRDAKDYSECLLWLRSLWSIYEEFYGRYHPDTLRALLRLILVKRKLLTVSHHPSSSSRISSTRPCGTPFCHDENELTQSSLETSVQSQCDTAEEIHEWQVELLKRLRNLYEEDHPNIVQIKKLGADILFDQYSSSSSNGNLGNNSTSICDRELLLNELLSNYRDLYNTLSSRVGFKNVMVLEIINRMGYLMIFHLYRVEQGLSLASKALEDVLLLYGPQDPIVPLYESNYLAMLDSVRRYDEDHGVSTAFPSHLLSVRVPSTIPALVDNSMEQESTFSFQLNDGNVNNQPLISLNPNSGAVDLSCSESLFGHCVDPE